jgi:branched-chain amino acid transport system permease protein
MTSSLHSSPFAAFKVPLFLVTVAILALMPLDLTSYGIPWGGLKRYGVFILSMWLVTAIAAMGVNLIMGYAGQETLAQAAFLGLGAYMTALLTKAGWPWGVAFLASGVTCFVVGFLLGFPALRVQSHYLAFVTLAFSIFAWLVFRNEEWLTGGVSGIHGVPRPEILGIKTKPFVTFYHFVMIITAVMSALMWWLLRSPWGRAFTALRENPIRAESLGIDVRGYKLLAFAIGSAYGGCAGALYAPLVEFIDPQPFALAPSLYYLLMIVIGGMGSFIGPFIGSAIAVLLPEWLRAYQGLAPIIFAVLVMVMIPLAPGGIVGLWQKLTARKPDQTGSGPAAPAPSTTSAPAVAPVVAEVKS